MDNPVSKHLINASYQLRDFLRTDHKFSDLISVDTKSFITDITSQNPSPATPKPVRTRRGTSIELEENRWPQS